MAYRKYWWKYGENILYYIKQKLASYSINSTDVKHADTYFDNQFGKTMHLLKYNSIPNGPSSSNRVWINSDMFCCWSEDGIAPGLEPGDVVMLAKDTGISPATLFPLIKKTTGTSDAPWLCGVIATEGDFNPVGTFRMWGVAQQGIYNVKFNNIASPTWFVAGNMATISTTTQGRAVQGGKTATTGVIGVITETILWDPAIDGAIPTIPVIIQSYSSK